MTNRSILSAALAAEYSARADVIKSSIAGNAATLTDAELRKVALDCLVFDFLVDVLSEYASRFVRTKAVPRTGGQNSTDIPDGSFDRVALAPGAFGIQVEIPALPALPDGKGLTATIEDSADNVGFTAVTGLDAIVVTGASGSGSPARTVTVTPPATIRQYVRVSLALDAAAGDQTQHTVTCTLLF